MSLLTDARREARKAFLAFSSNDAKTLQADSEPVHDKPENYIEQPASDDVQSSQNTPVSKSSICFFLLCVFFPLLPPFTFIYISAILISY